MCCRIVEMREKQVICIKDGSVIGYVGDIEVDTCCGKITSIIIYGRRRCFGLLGRDGDCKIPWENIEVIGEDSILVNFTAYPQKVCRRNFMNDLFGPRN